MYILAEKSMLCTGYGLDISETIFKINKNYILICIIKKNI